MEFVNVRELKAHASELIRQKEPVIVLRGSRPAGVFIPWEAICLEDEVRRTAQKALLDKMMEERREKWKTEEEVQEDFAAFRNRCRRR